MNHLNQRKSPSALLVSKEIETKFCSSSFFQKSRKVPEVADLSIVCGWGGRLSLKFVKFVKKACVFSELMRSCVEGMRRLSGNLIFCHLAFLNYSAFFPTGGQTSSSWGRGYDMGHVLRLFTREKSHRNLLSETINNTGSLLFDIYHRTKNV